jgi:hypothetical protein
MLKYYGNFQEVDWNSILTSIKSQQPEYVGPRHRAGDEKAPGVDEVADIWSNAGYTTIDNGGNASWDMFLPEINFDKEIVFKFAKFVNVESYTNAWISRVNPGFVAPWHWDVTDNETTLAQKNCVRFHCHIQPLNEIVGHTLIVEDTCLYNQKPGEVYEWSDRRNWHGAANCGTEPMYLFNFWYSW